MRLRARWIPDGRASVPVEMRNTSKHEAHSILVVIISYTFWTCQANMKNTTRQWRLLVDNAVELSHGRRARDECWVPQKIKRNGRGAVEAIKETSSSAPTSQLPVRVSWQGITAISPRRIVCSRARVFDFFTAATLATIIATRHLPFMLTFNFFYWSPDRGGICIAVEDRSFDSIRSVDLCVPSSHLSRGFLWDMVKKPKLQFLALLIYTMTHNTIILPAQNPH